MHQFVLLFLMIVAAGPLFGSSVELKCKIDECRCLQLQHVKLPYSSEEIRKVLGPQPSDDSTLTHQIFQEAMGRYIKMAESLGFEQRVALFRELVVLMLERTSSGKHAVWRADEIAFEDGYVVFMGPVGHLLLFRADGSFARGSTLDTRIPEQYRRFEAIPADDVSIAKEILGPSKAEN